MNKTVQESSNIIKAIVWTFAVLLFMQTVVLTRSIHFLHAKAATARLSHRNSVRLSVSPSFCPFVTWVDQSKTAQGAK